MSDLIKRQNAIDAALTFLCGAAFDEDMQKMLCERLDALSSAEPERKWIPVTERLPEDNRQVLVYAQNTHFALAKYDEMREADGKYRKQWVTFDAWKPFYTIKNVIAWMLLPEPWRGE